VEFDFLLERNKRLSLVICRNICRDRHENMNQLEICFLFLIGLKDILITHNFYISVYAYIYVGLWRRVQFDALPPFKSEFLDIEMR
jgi:hypothetical protein